MNKAIFLKILKGRNSAIFKGKTASFSREIEVKCYKGIFETGYREGLDRREI